MNELLHSSDGSRNLSTTVEGALTVIIAVLVLLGAQFGFSIPEQELGIISQQLVESTGYIVAAVGSLITVYGSIKKLYYKLVKSKKS